MLERPTLIMPAGNRSLHAILVTRLVMVTALISVFVAFLVVINEKYRVSKVATDRALIRAGTLRVLAQGYIDANRLDDRAGLEALLKAVAYKGFDLDAGHYVFLRITDPSGKEIARTVDHGYDRLAVLERHADSGAWRTPVGIRAPEVTRTRIGSGTYLQARVPLLSTQGKVAAYLEGIFATSAEEEKKMFLDLVRVVGLAVGTVIATTLLLYPVIVRLMRRLARLSQSLLDSNLETLRVVGSAIAKRDSDTDIHNYRVTIYSVRLAEKLGLDSTLIRVLIRGAFLHDVGKIGVRDKVLLKPGKLNAEEFAEMKSHVDHGIDIVSRSSWLGEAVSVVAGHHEKYSGDGYPAALTGEDIPVLARIFAIVDVFDALSSRRPYKEPIAYDEAIEILSQGRGAHFDPEILDAFVQIARPLFDLYGNNEDDHARVDLSEIMDRYYNVDVAAFLD